MSNVESMTIDPSKVILHHNGLRCGLLLSDGIHYGVRGSLIPQQINDLHAAIVRRINAVLLGDRLAPAGMIRGVLDVELPIQSISSNERDVMTDYGVNPIIVHKGAAILYGNLFMYQGKYYHMSAFFRHEPPVHPYITDFLRYSINRIDYLGITRAVIDGGSGTK